MANKIFNVLNHLKSRNINTHTHTHTHTHKILYSEVWFEIFYVLVWMRIVPVSRGKKLKITVSD